MQRICFCHGLIQPHPNELHDLVRYRLVCDLQAPTIGIIGSTYSPQCLRARCGFDCLQKVYINSPISAGK